ncbi:MAG: hypothetical protein Q4B50_00945, partial [Bacillota bacterium]|nr:hypothetical protein [Bacillota bacterium]
LQDSHWANPHGLDADDHYTSAHDLAMITREAMKLPKFNELIVSESWTMPWESNEYDRTLYNHNQLLDLYEGGDGVKTGYTSKSGSCLVGSASRDGLRLIGVVLNCDAHYEEMCKLLDYGFASYESQQLAEAGDMIGSVKVLNGNVKRLDVVLAEDARITVEKGTRIESEPEYDFPPAMEAPLADGQIIGTARYTDGKGTVSEIPICVKGEAQRYTFGLVWKSVWRMFFGAFLDLPPVEE